jgi:hypothetical protein
MTGAAAAGGPRVIEMAAVVLGYGLAAVGLRLYAPTVAQRTLVGAVAAAVLLAWLGLALSGPFVLLLDRRHRREGDWTRPEAAWGLIGLYGLVLVGAGPFVLPSGFAGRSVAAIGLLPVLGGLVAWLVAPRSAPRRPPRWTERAAAIVIATWPLAWFALIALAARP